MQLLYLLLLFLSILVQADDIATTLYPYIYTNLNNWPCVRLLNASGTIGCQALHKKSGILFETTTQQAIDDFVNQAPSGDDYAIVIPYPLLSKVNIESLSSTAQVSGLIALLLPNQTSFSPDSTCPQCSSGSYQWNPEAQDLIDQTFDFPIFAIRPEDDISQQAYEHIENSLAYNRERQFIHYPLKAMDFDLLMWAAVNSETCLRRDIKADDNKPIIVVSANLDSRSLFHDLTVGASEHVSGLVTVLAIAEALSRAPVALDTLPKHILFTLFAAEPWGFAGSQRFVNDISSPFVCTNATRAYTCPYSNTPCTFPCVRNLHFTNININQIQSIFEFQSVSGINSNYTGGYYVHANSDQSSSLVEALDAYDNIKPASSDGIKRPLPPSSAMSFLQKRSDIQAAVITDYQSQLGSLYHSDLDDTLDIEQATHAICGLVNSTANVIYAEASNTTATLTADCTLISSILDCLISNFSCAFMQDYFNVTNVSRIPHYVSVLSFENPQVQLIAKFAFSYLSGIHGKKSMNNTLCKTIRDCDSSQVCIKQQCVASLTTYHEAYGTGLQYEESTGQVKVIDTTKATWTESTWDNPSMRIFLTTSHTHQIVEFVIGLLWLITSFISVFFVKKYLVKTLKTE
ncbi:hypothetical protein CU098_011379 [Rhizopus stolonifer]|uniref:Nicastrin n=1 Tax=Rhizopus stolonifer TaxID=4846 RepID=A0A367KPF3_RHIST|nr:hypothetical protein CU098_011379 [Rhizopus stolonifer]